MQINPYLMFSGQCEAAFNFYAQVLGGKIAFKITYGESPEAEKCPSAMKNQIMHAHLVVGSLSLMGSDSPPDRFNKPQGMFISLGIEKPEEAERIFKTLSENANVLMPIGETFWAQRFGMLVDQFGTPWMINCEKPRS